MHVERTIKLGRPPLVESGRQLVAGDNAAGGVRQELQDVVFDGRERHRGPVRQDFACRRDQPDPAGLQDLGLLGNTAGPPEDRPNSGHQLGRAERLGQVIVRAGVQAGHAVGLGRAGCQHDHRELALPPDQSEHLEAVQPRHHHVEKQQVVPPVEGAGQAAPAVMHGLQADFTAGKKLLQQLTQLDIVIHQQDRHAGLRCLSACLDDVPGLVPCGIALVPIVRNRGFSRG